MTWLRLVGRPAAPIDLMLVRTVERIVRSDGGVWVQATAGSCDELRRGLAFAGLAVREEAAPSPGPELLAAIGSTLAPAAGTAIEALTLRSLELADATARVLGRRWFRAAWPAYRSARRLACREVLRERDALASWERRAWFPPGAIRLATVRRSFRPIVFDRGALDAPRPAGLLHARDGEITRWAFG